MKENYTHIGIILDRSGSMNRVADDTIGGFNDFLKSQKEVDGEATFSLTLFDDQIDKVYDFEDLKKVKPLDNKTYTTRGMTSLFDAIGVTVSDIGTKLNSLEEDDRPSKVIITIMTDGFENSSKEYTQKSIKNIIERQRNEYSWEFVFLGANQDAFLTSEGLGINKGSSMSYAASDVGTRYAFASISEAYTVSRGCPSAQTTFSEKHYEDQDKELVKAGQQTNNK